MAWPRMFAGSATLARQGSWATGTLVAGSHHRRRGGAAWPADPFRIMRSGCGGGSWYTHVHGHFDEHPSGMARCGVAIAASAAARGLAPRQAGDDQAGAGSWPLRQLGRPVRHPERCLLRKTHETITSAAGAVTMNVCRVRLGAAAAPDTAAGPRLGPIDCYHSYFSTTRSSRGKVPGDTEMAPYAYLPSPLVAAPAAHVARGKVPGDTGMAPYAYLPSPLVAAPAAYVAFGPCSLPARRLAQRGRLARRGRDLRRGSRMPVVLDWLLWQRIGHTLGAVEELMTN